MDEDDIFAALPAGWGFPGASRKAHYFKAGQAFSLCSKWMYTGPRETEVVASPDDCAICTRSLAKQKSKGE